MARYVEAKFAGPFYNPTACEYFERLCKNTGICGQHAGNGGEVKIAGYFVDLYDFNKNIVVEYDEEHHEKPSYKQNDVKRQSIIMSHTGGRMFRYSKKNNIFYEVTNE